MSDATIERLIDELREANERAEAAEAALAEARGEIERLRAALLGLQLMAEIIVSEDDLSEIGGGAMCAYSVRNIARAALNSTKDTDHVEP